MVSSEPALLCGVVEPSPSAADVFVLHFPPGTVASQVPSGKNRNFQYLFMTFGISITSSLLIALGRYKRK